VLPALLLLAAAWSLLASAAWLAPLVGRAAAVFASFTAVTALVIAARRRDGDRGAGLAAGLGALAGLAGFASYPLWVAGIAALGAAIGLRAVTPPAGPDEALLLIAQLALAPIFEELLYRERLLPALQARLGTGLAVALSSALFALPHLEAWSMLTTFGVGLALGGVLLVGRSVALCIGLHAGLNLAAAVCGIPPTRFILPGALAAACSAALLAVGLFAARRTRPAVVAADGH
jgi:membrane protease YdiL (CAAX protease family)